MTDHGPAADSSVEYVQPFPESQGLLPSINSMGDCPRQYHNQQDAFHPPDPLDPAVTMRLPTTLTYDSLGQADDSDLLENEPIIDFQDLALTEFLNDLVVPASAMNNALGLDQLRQLPSRDVLDFNMDDSFTFMHLNSLPLMQDVNYNQSFSTAAPIDTEANRRQRESSITRSGHATPYVRGTIMAGAQAFKDSLWLWVPSREDNFAAFVNSSFPGRVYESSTVSPGNFLLSHEQIDHQARDRVVAMVLETVDRWMFTKIVASLPSTQIMSTLIHTALYMHSTQVEKWLHLPSLHINQEPPIFVAAMVALGAVLSPVPELQTLGLALQESVRHSFAKAMESDNTKTRDLRMLQASAIELYISLWSGNKRKMEISESFSQPTITMMRRAGHFRQLKRSWQAPAANDDPEVLETKYNAWVEAESFKRLALHFFSRDRQISMSLLNPPLISYAEVSIELPFSADLWQAKSAGEWKDVFLAKSMANDTRLPSLRTCIEDTSAISPCMNFVDTQMSLMGVLSGIWALIWHFRERKNSAKFVDNKGPRNSPMFTHSLYQEISQIMEHLRLCATEWVGIFPPEATLLYEQCMLHLHVSLEDVQLLAGKGGEEEARRMLPVLCSWKEDRDSRQALFRAGQIVRAAKACVDGVLRDALAIAIYHASLVFWAYTVVSRSMSVLEKGKAVKSINQAGDDDGLQVVCLDGDETSPELQRFLVLGRGRPGIGSCAISASSTTANLEPDIPLDNPRAVMNMLISLLRAKNVSSQKGGPPLVENLSKLMKGLGNAASGVRG